MKLHAPTTAFELGILACLLWGFTIARFLQPRHDPICPPGEKYMSCASPDCREFTCWRMTLPENCTIQCISGCFCLGDLFRNSDGQCVTFHECALDHNRRSSYRSGALHGLMGHLQ